MWFVIIQGITKLDDRKVGVRFVTHEYDYGINHKDNIFRETQDNNILIK